MQWSCLRVNSVKRLLVTSVPTLRPFSIHTTKFCRCSLATLPERRWNSLCPTVFNKSSGDHSFRCSAEVTDIGMRTANDRILSVDYLKPNERLIPFEQRAMQPQRGDIASIWLRESLYGDRVLSLDCRWSAKFYGQVTFGPRGFAYPSSRWLARRFRMKKHKIIKRFRFRRYKLAAVANLPFAKMIRVGMLPELKSSKTRAGDVVDAGLTSQLVTQAQRSTGGKVKGRRSRPKSKYQV